MDTLHPILETKGTAVHAIGPDETVFAAAEAMCSKHVGALLVTRANQPLGIFSERDLMRRVVLERRDPRATRVGDVMTREVVCVDIETSPEESMRIMTERRCRHLPVVLDGKVVGMLSIGDLVRWASRNQEFEIRMLHEYLEGKYPG